MYDEKLTAMEHRFATSEKDDDKFTCLCTGKREIDTNSAHTMNEKKKPNDTAVNCEEHKRRTSNAQVYVNRYKEKER